MRRIKLNDVARIAGVSMSTVDRVLNRRPGVKADTRKRVDDAMRRLGYSQSALAQRMSDLAPTVAVLVPADTPPTLKALSVALTAEVARRNEAGIATRIVSVGPFDGDTLAEALDSLDDTSGAIISPLLETTAVARAIDAATERGATVIGIYSDAPDTARAAFIGSNSYVSGRTAGAMMAHVLPTGASRVAVLIGNPVQREHLDRRSGFEQALIRLRPEAEVLAAGSCRNDDETARRLTERVLSADPPYDGLYVIGDAHGGVLQALSARPKSGLKVIAHDLSAAGRKALASGAFLALVVQDLDALARHSFDVALGAGKNRVHPVSVVLAENLPPE